MKIAVTTAPFGNPDPTPRKQLQGLDVEYNTIDREMNSCELASMLSKIQPDIIIAGTEKYTPEILALDPNLKLIARVGVGLDSVDLEECKKRNIIVTFTPTAPSNAVAELTIAQMIIALRHVQNVDLL